ncbi:hypothetical protein EVAR_88253_1 [Eumeta japonica]|uniref:Uncharacterized protein n=1 Tax=Eumeta variegata TaxID=151549 RepID=A0A4C1XKI7_EUMVA|nr:hypothetical protein EVAR_88253_1 [Eumeta japonica]
MNMWDSLVDSRTDLTATDPTRFLDSDTLHRRIHAVSQPRRSGDRANAERLHPSTEGAGATACVAISARGARRRGHFRGGNEHASHQRISGHRRPRVSEASEESPVRYRPLGDKDAVAIPRLSCIDGRKLDSDSFINRNSGAGATSIYTIDKVYGIRYGRRFRIYAARGVTRFTAGHSGPAPGVPPEPEMFLQNVALHLKAHKGRTSTHSIPRNCDARDGRTRHVCDLEIRGSIC